MPAAKDLQVQLAMANNNPRISEALRGRDTVLSIQDTGCRAAGSPEPGLFIAKFRRWLVPATGRELIDDIKRTPDDVLSNAESINKGLLKVIDTYSKNLARSKLMRDTACLFNDVREDLVMVVNVGSDMQA
ncbi:hypothetical protein V8E52_005002 [Russula decolorans]